MLGIKDYISAHTVKKNTLETLYKKHFMFLIEKQL